VGQTSSLFLLASLRLGGFLLLACGPATRAKAPETKVVATKLEGPPGATLVQACTPTGPELCFNAIDDNCNGVIDEGCGVQTGVLQFTVAWGASPADVNLAVNVPDKEADKARVDLAHTTVGGFHFDHDCPSDNGCNGQSTENVFFEGSEPPRGHYIVEISLGDLHGADSPVRVRFGARLGARTVGFDVDLAPGQDSRKTFSFDLP